MVFRRCDRNPIILISCALRAFIRDYEITKSGLKNSLYQSSEPSPRCPSFLDRRQCRLHGKQWQETGTETSVSTLCVGSSGIWSALTNKLFTFYSRLIHRGIGRRIDHISRGSP